MISCAFCAAFGEKWSIRNWENTPYLEEEAVLHVTKEDLSSEERKTIELNLLLIGMRNWG